MLTNFEKEILDNVVIEIIREKDSQFCIADIVCEATEKCGFAVAPASVSGSFNRIAKKNENFAVYKSGYCNNRNYYRVGRGIYLDSSQGITKEKNILHFGCNSKLTYDFISGKFNYEKNEIYGNHWQTECIKEDWFSEMLKYEWLFNYVTSIRTIDHIYNHLPKEAYEKMPKGFINIVKETDEYTFATKLGQYYAEEILCKNNKYPHLLHQLTKLFSLKDLISLLRYISIDNLVKMIKNGIVNGEIDIENDIYEVMKQIKTLEDMGKVNLIRLDVNRDLPHNALLLDNIANAERNEKLAKQMQKLNFINNMTIEDSYIIKVPQTQIEKIEEGRMQNNCVGHYYDDSILEGRNLIYFIRLKNNPEKSYITCRYNMKYKATVEARKVNNRPINNKDEEKMLSKIDAIIRENLGV